MSSTSIIFTGDIGFDKYMDGKWDDEGLVSAEVMSFLHSADHLVINVEGPLSQAKKVTLSNGQTGLQHTMNPAAVSFFEKIGADIWNINNNHIMDAGADGLVDTLKEAAKAGADTIGAGIDIMAACRPLILPEAGGIGLVSVGYERACRIAGEDTPGCINFSRMDLIEESIKKVKQECRWCVVVAHDGEEFTALPSPYTRDRFHRYLEMGADVVVAHHPHVPMNYELVNDKIIFYSLGNFIFDTDYQRAQDNTEKGIFVKLSFNEEKLSFEPFGIRINRDKGCVEADKVPAIFENVDEHEYELLKALNAKFLIENTKRQLRFLKPELFGKATEEDFVKNFNEPMRSGRVPGELLDFQIIYPLSLEATNGEWKKSKLEKVKEYMLASINVSTIN